MKRSMFGMQLALHSQAVWCGPSPPGLFSGGPLCGDDATGIIWPSWEPVSRIKVWVAAWLTTPGQVVSKQDPPLLINDGSSLCIDRWTNIPKLSAAPRPSHRALASHACHGTSLFAEEPACGQRPAFFLGWLDAEVGPLLPTWLPLPVGGRERNDLLLTAPGSFAEFVCRI